MFDHQWRVATGTILGLVVEPGTHFDWKLRLLQSALALAVGAAIATALRRSVHALWLAPLGLVIVRLVLDPLAFGWYFLEPEALVLVGAGLVLSRLRNLRAWLDTSSISKASEQSSQGAASSAN
jgi:hypothetical protein